ncbi:uncharacterized protein TM35_000052640 [Trypanosoma theileri]|uniref:Uncharacterized protein n=1 Tax=Trypanosoma theileri TaxID=67003 RepID=A0A1X0P4B2_9TRYP|nr:uncharacterized protein TM35_000052640 [Trypanosoma theileri]ORC91668.1 hypothetical protein TM35_000052640 [Trypanosoma theileri]
MNDILCRSETADASFRPSDVFVGLDPPPVRTPLLGEVASNHNYIHSANSIAAATTTNTNDNNNNNNDNAIPIGVDRDCPIFNTFGVLSGGVLVDPISQKFVDFVDDIIFSPTISQKEKENENEVHYQTLKFSKIQAEGVLFLCSSIEPFNASGTQRTPLCWPRSHLMNSNDAGSLAQRNIQYILSHSVSEMSLKQEDLFTVEFFRCHMKCLRPQMTFMTESTPFRVQYGGKIFPPEETDNSNNNNNNNTAATTSPTTTPIDTTTNTVSFTTVEGEGSPYSEFHCFTGLPKMAYRKHEEKICRIPGKKYAQRLELRLQNLLRPFRGDFYVANRPERTRFATAHKRAWWIFLRYFEFLRVYSLPTPDVSGRTIWQLPANDDNTSGNHHSSNNNGNSGSGGMGYMDSLRSFETARLNGQTAKVNMYATADAWDWLLRNDRDRLMRRIRRLQYGLRKIEAERNTSSQG